MKKSLSILFFLSILSLSQIAFSQNAINYEKSDLFIHVNIPSLAYHPNNAYDCNIIQSYGLGIEYKFKNRLALSFNFTRNIQDFDYNVLNKNITYNSFVYKPSLRYYLDSNSKVYVDLGAVVNSCNDKIMENNVINEEKFVQNAITTGIGYKVYFLKNKRITAVKIHIKPPFPKKVILGTRKSIKGHSKTFLIIRISSLRSLRYFKSTSANSL